MCDEAIEDLLRDVNMVVTRLSWPFLLPDTTVVEPPVWRTVPADAKRDGIFQLGRIVAPMEIESERVARQAQQLARYGQFQRFARIAIT